jgi:hypothetical protein
VIEDGHYLLRKPWEGDEEYVQAKAAEHNCEVVNASDYVLQLDFDSPEIPDDGAVVFGLLKDLGFIPEDTRWEQWRSKSGNWHVQIHFDEPVPARQRVLLQALLGSDPKREALNLARIHHGCENPIRLFRPRVPVAAPEQEPHL